PPYRRITHVLVAPEKRGTLGAIAERVLAERYGGWKALRDPDFLVLARLCGGGRARARGELLSFLFFDEAFAEALIEAGREAAQAWLARHPALWSTADDELSEVDARAARGLIEQATLDEYRAWRRR
ncbi:MAG TPA: patatin, partial [Solirubrobacteraceae bacterium]